MTADVIRESVGWVLLIDGVHKSSYGEAAEGLLLRDVDSRGQFRHRFLGFNKCTAEDVTGYEQVGLRPYGASAQKERMLSLLHTTGDGVNADGLVQLCSDGSNGASVNSTVGSFAKFRTCFRPESTRATSWNEFLHRNPTAPHIMQ